MANILSLSRFQPSMLEKTRILIEGGHRVFSASSLNDAVRFMQQTVFDVVILGESIAPGTRGEFINALRRLDPSLAFLLLTSQNMTSEIYDAVLPVRCAPEDLLQLVLLMLFHNRQKNKQPSFSLESGSQVEVALRSGKLPAERRRAARA